MARNTWKWTSWFGSASDSCRWHCGKFFEAISFSLIFIRSWCLFRLRLDLAAFDIALWFWKSKGRRFRPKARNRPPCKRYSRFGRMHNWFSKFWDTDPCTKYAASVINQKRKIIVVSNYHHNRYKFEKESEEVVVVVYGKSGFLRLVKGLIVAAAGRSTDEGTTDPKQRATSTRY